MSLIKFRATKNDVDRTIFKFLIKQLNNVPVSKIEKLFRQKDLKINGKRINDKSYKIVENDLIEIYGISDHLKEDTFQKTQILFKVLYEDQNILVVDKPINIAIHGEDNCLDWQVLTYLNYQKHDSFQPSHVGRLDKDTSGIMIYAKTYQALVELNKKTNFFQKYYQLKSDFPWTKKHVVLYAHFDQKTQKRILLNKQNNQKMETIFFQDQNKQYAQIITGKKHQIRITLAHLNYPIYGDKKYGGPYAKRLLLHCTKIVLNNLEGVLEYLNEIAFISPIKWNAN